MARTGDDVSQDAPTDGPDGDDGADTEWGMGPIPFALLVLFEASLAPASLLLGALVRQHPLAMFRWDRHDAVVGLLAALPMLGLVALILRWPVGPLKGVKDYLRNELVPALRGCEWPDLGVLSVSSGVAEEMLFRGVLQGFLGYWLGRWPGLILASLLFGLLHPVSLSYVAVASLLGSYLGLVWMLSGNLLTVMVAHTFYDFVVLLFLLHTAEPEPEPGDDGTPA